MKTIRYLLLIFAAFILVSISYICIDGFVDEKKESDVCIVLGNKVFPDGTPSERLKSRLDKCYDLYSDGLVSNIIVSGGTGVEGFDESLAMKIYLIDLGIPSENIVQDKNGSNTWNTAVNSSIIMKDHSWDSAIVVSQFYHITRCKIAFKKAGIPAVNSASSDFFELRDIYSTLREIPALLKYILTKNLV